MTHDQLTAFSFMMMFTTLAVMMMQPVYNPNPPITMQPIVVEIKQEPVVVEIKQEPVVMEIKIKQVEEKETQTNPLFEKREEEIEI